MPILIFFFKLIELIGQSSQCIQILLDELIDAVKPNFGICISEIATHIDDYVVGLVSISLLPAIV